MQRIQHNHSFGGWHSRYEHEAQTTQCTMRFAIYLPPQASAATPVPVLYWLSGLTSTEENFMQKAGAQRVAAELGIAIVAADTSPRGEGVADNPDYDLGQGAGFYVNATQEPWKKHYHMYDYCLHELPELIEQNFPVTQQRSISGHSMGGHGALVLALRNPEKYCSASAFAPICHPIEAPWGQKAFSHYLGDDKQNWETYDATHLMQQTATKKLPLQIWQGMADEWLATQLKLDDFTQAAKNAHYPITLEQAAAYDHNYYFVASFIEQDLIFHHKQLIAQAKK